MTGSSGEALVRAAGRTALGTRHKVNEDAHAVTVTGRGGALLLLCDGMGGMGSGDAAARVALDLLVKRLTEDAPEDVLSVAQSAVQQADLTVMRSFEASGGKKPGTTCAGVVIEAGLAHLFWVGDSTILLIRDGQVLERSHPHRMVQELIDAGTMTKEEAAVSPLKSYLSRSLGARDESKPVDPDVRKPVPLKLGDRIVVCSDGLTDFVEPHEIVDIILGYDDPGAAADRLVELALERETNDNVTCLVARVAPEAESDASDVVGDAWDILEDPPAVEEAHTPKGEAAVPAAPGTMPWAVPLGILALLASGVIIALLIAILATLWLR